MGQMVRILGVRSLSDTVLRYEIDRSLTGMAHESYLSADAASRDRPADVLASALFATGHVSAVHVFSNIITVTLRATVPTGGEAPVRDALDLAIRELFVHYHPGVLPTAVTDGADA